MEALNEINVTPLIDLAFALLIIFMIATPLLSNDSARFASRKCKISKRDRGKVQLIHVNAKGTFFGPICQLVMKKCNKVENSAQQTNPPVLKVRADKKLSYGRVIELMDLIKQNKLSRISLDTVVQ